LILKFKSGELEDPFFWCANNLEEILALIPHLNDKRPIYSFRTIDLILGAANETVQALASLYVDEIISIHPNGPYHLGGYCWGGIIAFEIAQQLVARGHVVETLIVAEVEPQLQGELIKFLRRVKRVQAYWRKLHELSPDRSILYSAYALCRKVTSKLISIMKQQVADIAFNQLSKHDDNALPSGYEMRSYSGRLNLIFSEDSDSGVILRFKAEHSFAHRLFGPKTAPQWLAKWERIEGVKIDVLPGNHHKLVSEELYIARLAEQIDACMKADKRIT
jgi:thioesterase domain-containing protein